MLFVVLCWFSCFLRTLATAFAVSPGMPVSASMKWSSRFGVIGVQIPFSKRMGVFAWVAFVSRPLGLKCATRSLACTSLYSSCGWRGVWFSFATAFIIAAATAALDPRPRSCGIALLIVMCRPVFGCPMWFSACLMAVTMGPSLGGAAAASPE